MRFIPKVVFNILYSLPGDKACGLDLLPARLLKEGAESIVCHFLIYLRNLLRLVFYHLIGFLKNN